MNDKFYNQLDHEEKLVYNKYKSNTDGFAYKLNDYLRQGIESQIFDTEILTLDRIISKYKSFDNIELHRATVDTLVLPFISEMKYTNPDYISTSTDLESIETHFTNPIQPVYIKFICHKETLMCPLEGNKQFSGLENEVILGRNNNFEIIQNEIIKERRIIENIMGKFYAEGVDKLRTITMSNMNYYR